MTDRLYYTEPGLREFDATVVAVDSRDGRTVVRLDRTAFYPTSGGQPFDIGTLGAARVVDVFDDIFDDTEGTESAESPASNVMHVVESDELRVGQQVHGTIDWSPRFDHMQQHTGQHVLSAAFDTFFDARTASFHLGAESATIDLEREMTPAQIAV